MAKKAYVGVPNFEMVSLPEGYTQVEYIESSGTQYIDTGFKPNQNTRVVIDVDMTGSIGLSFPTVFSTDSSGTVGYRFTTMLYAEYDGFHDHYGNQTVNSSNINVYSRYILDKNKNVTYLNGKVVSAFSGVSFQSAVPLLLLASLDAGTYQYFAKAKIYSCKVYDNGTLVRDYIPCTNSSGVAGLYDLVSKEFYVNAGTGAFTTGTSTQNSVAKDVTSMYIGVPRFELVELPEGYTQVEYIKSSIGAYIDTEYKANNNTRVVSDHEFVSGDPYPNLFGAWDKSLTNSFIYVVLADMKTAAPLYGSKQINQVYDCTGRKTIDFNKNIVKLNGNTVATFDSQTFSCSYNMYVFAYNSAGVASNMTEAYVYSFKIYDNENLVRNFIPCVNAAGAAGLYDIVNGKFYGNSGSGILSAGAACKQDTYTQVEYIQSNGTQWINTNHRVSSQNIRYVCKMAYTGDNSDGVSFGGGSTSGYAIALFRNEPAFWVGTSSAICGFAMERGVDYELDISANNGTFVFLKDGADQQTTFYGGTMSSENPISIFAQNVTGTGHQFASIRISYFKIYDNDVLVRDYIPCVNSSGVAGLYDLANRVFYTNAGTGVFAIGENVGEIETGDAEKPVARYVLKGYIGVGNVARPF